MRHLYTLESKHFNAKFFEAEHVLDVLKIEHDIMDIMPFNSEYIRMVWSRYGMLPKSTCPFVPIMHPLHVTWKIPDFPVRYNVFTILKLYRSIV